RRCAGGCCRIGEVAMSRECCGPDEPVVAEPVDDCCGPAAPGGDEHEEIPPWWRDPALALPVASGLLWATGLVLQWPDLNLPATIAFALGLIAGAWTFVPGTVKRLFTAKGRGKLGVGLLMTIAAIGAERPRRSEEHTSELQSRSALLCRLMLEREER